MISDEFKKIIERFKKEKVENKHRLIEGIKEDKIKSFENQYNIILPDKYKEWLEFSDGGDLYLPAGIQLYGVSHKPIIDLEIKERPNDTYYAIGALSTGDPILANKNSQKISIYDQGAGEIHDDEEYDDFLSFISDINNILDIGE